MIFFRNNHFERLSIFIGSFIVYLPSYDVIAENFSITISLISINGMNQ